LGDDDDDDKTNQSMTVPQTIIEAVKTSKRQTHIELNPSNLNANITLPQGSTSAPWPV
jgi:hypothetical protein